MKKYKYDIGIMFIDDFNDFIAKCNKKGQEGWELIQWEYFNRIDPLSRTQPCWNSVKMNILATWRLAYED